MIDQELLNILRCPETRQPLTVADSALLASLNARISAGVVKDRSGQPVTEKLDDALVRADGAVAYAVRQGTPMLIRELAIPLK